MVCLVWLGNYISVAIGKSFFEFILVFTKGEDMLIFIIAFMVIIFDQLTKFLIVKNLYGSSVEIIENIFSLTYVENCGAAWGFLSNNSWILMIFIPVIVVIIIWYLFAMGKNRYERISGGLIIGGAIGNYIDRLFRGYVVDFLDFKIWPVFNVADIAIVLGCIIMIVFLCIKGGENDGEA